MAYPDHIREKAFRIYAGTTSYEDTAAQMREIYPRECRRLTKNAVAKWAIDRKLNWKGRLERVRREIRAATDKSIIDDRQQTIANLRVLRDDIFYQIKGQKMKSLEGGAAALRNIIKSLDELTGGSGKMRVNIEKVLMVIIQVFNQDEKLRAMLVEKQPYLIRKIEEELGDANG